MCLDKIIIIHTKSSDCQLRNYENKMFLPIWMCIFLFCYGHAGKIESLIDAISKSPFYGDIDISESTILCKPCQTTISNKDSSHFSNIIRHFFSDTHKTKACWTVKEMQDGLFSAISLVQKTTLHNFFRPKKENESKRQSCLEKRRCGSKTTPANVLNTKEAVPVHSFIVKDILQKEKAKINENIVQFQKSKQLTKSILVEERLALAFDGHQCLQLREQILTFLEYMKNALGTKTEALLSHITSRESMPTFYLSNLFQLSSRLLMDIEKCESKEVEIAQLTKTFIIDRYQIITSIAENRKLIQNKCTTEEILSKVEEKAWDSCTRDYPDILVSLSLLLEEDNFLSTFLRDILENMKKQKPIWSDTTLSMFSLLLNYGGPSAVELISKNFGGPHLSTVYTKTRQHVSVETILKPEAFALASVFYRNILKAAEKLENLVFTIAIDATPILPLIRARGNMLVGFSSLDNIKISTAEDIIQAFKNKDLKPAQQTYVIILAPLRSDIPYYILAAPPVTKGESHKTVETMMEDCLAWGIRNGINIVGLGADGDAKIRAYYQHHFLKNGAHLENMDNIFTIKRKDFMYHLPQITEHNIVQCPFPDPRHLIKKWRNQILNVRRLLILGSYSVQLEHLMEIADSELYKHRLGLWKTDIKVNDKQNVNAAVRLFQIEVRECLNEMNGHKFRGTICYLKLGSLLYQIYFSKDLSVGERIRYAWAVVQFVQLWRIWMQISGYNIDRNFISDQTFRDVLIAGHSFILFTKLHFESHRNQPFEPWTWGSNSCEEVFGKARCFVRTKNNFCHLEFLDICKRLQKVSEIEKNEKLKTKATMFVAKQNFIFEFHNIEKLLQDEMLLGDILAFEMVTEVEIHKILLAKGVIKIKNDGRIEYQDPSILYKTDRLGKHFNNEPDEMDLLSSDEVESLSETDIIHTVLGNDQQTVHSDDLQDIASTITDNEQDDTGQIMETSNEQAILDHEVTSTSVASAKIQLHVSTHDEVKESNCNSIEPIDDSKKNTHIFHRGYWYQINQFIAWEQGKFYMPKQSRLNRFFSNYAVFDKFIPSEQENLNTLKHNMVIASWKDGKYTLGFVRRIIRQSVRGKSVYPIFYWDKKGEKDVEIAIQVLNPNDHCNNGLCRLYTLSKKYIWIAGNEFVTRVQGTSKDDEYLLQGDSYEQLKAVLTDLKKADEAEEKRKREEKKRKLEEQKSGPPEKMTVVILKSVLKDKGIQFPSNSRKAALVELVKTHVTGINQGAGYSFRFRGKSSRKPRKKKALYGRKLTVLYVYSKYADIPDFNKHYLYFLQCIIILWTFLVYQHLKMTAKSNKMLICTNVNREKLVTFPPQLFPFLVSIYFMCLSLKLLQIVLIVHHKLKMRSKSKKMLPYMYAIERQPKTVKFPPHMLPEVVFTKT